MQFPPAPRSWLHCIEQKREEKRNLCRPFSSSNKARAPFRLTSQPRLPPTCLHMHRHMYIPYKMSSRRGVKCSFISSAVKGVKGVASVKGEAQLGSCDSSRQGCSYFLVYSSSRQDWRVARRIGGQRGSPDIMFGCVR